MGAIYTTYMTLLSKNLLAITIFQCFTNELRYNSSLFQSQEGDIPNDVNFASTSLMIGAFAGIPVSDIDFPNELIIIKRFENL